MRTFKVESLHTVYVDDYNEGELEQVNSYDVISEVKAENPIEAIKIHFEKHLGFSLDVDLVEIYDGIFEYSNIVDEENIEPSDLAKALWKENELVLYANNTSTHVYEIIKIELED